MAQHPTGEDMQGLSTEESSRHPYGIAGRPGDCHGYGYGYGPNGLPVESEYSWANGLVPSQFVNASPLEGGGYRGTARRASHRVGVSRDPRG